MSLLTENIRRYEIYGNRYYYTVIKSQDAKTEQKFIYGASVTTIINKLFGEDEFVKIKKHTMGEREFSNWWAELALKGTFEHIIFEEMVECYSEGKEPTKKLLYNNSWELNQIPDKYHQTIFKDLIAYSAYLKSLDLANAKSVQTEISFISESETQAGMVVYGGAADLLFTDSAGKTSLIDIKSGHYAEMPFKYELQLSMYAEAFGLPYDSEIKMVCPKDWRKEPSVNSFSVKNYKHKAAVALDMLYLNQSKFDLTKESRFEINDDFSYSKISILDELEKSIY